MSDFDFLAELLLLLSSAFSFVYGAKRHFKRRHALFLQIVICAMGSIALGQIYLVVAAFTGTLSQGFHVGMLGNIGCAFFLFSASFGQMDRLVDAGGRTFAIYRAIAFLAPLPIILSYCLILIAPTALSTKILYGFYFIIYAMAAYYFLKHLVLPDVEMGFIRCIRRYNYIGLLFVFTNILSLHFKAYNLYTASTICTILLAVICGVMVIVLEKGVKLWTV